MSVQLSSTVLPTGPNIPGWLQNILFSLSPYEFVHRFNHQFGDVFTLRLAGMGDTVMFSSPTAIKQIFALGGDGLHNGNDVVRYLLHEKSVVFLEADIHQTARKIMTPPLHGQYLKSYSPQFLASAQHVTATWTEGESINLHAAFQQITFQALLTAAVGDVDHQLYDQLVSSLIAFVNGQLKNDMFFASALLGSRLYDMIRSRTDANKQRLAAGKAPRRRGLFAARTANLARAEHYLEGIVKSRRERGTLGADILSRLLQAQHADQEHITDDFIVQQLLTILIAGHDTTSLALSWIVFQVLERPQVLAKILHELDSVMGGTFNITKTDDLTYLQLVVQESMRFTPIASFVPRRLEYDTEIDGVQIPAGVTIAANIIGAHARVATWQDPENFRPERFLEANATAWEFLPFGGGLRRCLGATFAMSEIQIVLAYLFHHWRFELEGGYKARPSVHGFLIGPARSLQCRISKVAIAVK
jgi:cytochrome P450